MMTHARAASILESREYEGSAPLRVAAFADSQNPLQWRGLVETDRAYRLFHLDLTKSFDPAQGEVLGKTQDSPAIQAALATRPFQVLREFAIYPLYRQIPDSDAAGEERVELSDVRFPFTSTALIDRNRRVLRSWFQFSGRSH